MASGERVDGDAFSSGPAVIAQKEKYTDIFAVGGNCGMRRCSDIVML